MCKKNHNNVKLLYTPQNYLRTSNNVLPLFIIVKYSFKLKKIMLRSWPFEIIPM